MRVGAMVFDRLEHEVVEVVHVRVVPLAFNLFGDPILPHQVFTVRYVDGQWADRREDELDATEIGIAVPA